VRETRKTLAWIPEIARFVKEYKRQCEGFAAKAWRAAPNLAR
jgi:hypothetical protein